MTCLERSAEERARLRRLISIVDGRLPDGGNCYRRALVEMAVDPISASERLHFGLNSFGGRRTGHAWLSSDRPHLRYDAEFTI